MMKSIFIYCFLSLFSFLTFAEDEFTESQLFANFKNENYCWYGIEYEMTKESEKIVDFLKKFSTELKSNSPDFWQDVSDKIEARFPSFDFSACDSDSAKPVSSDNVKLTKADIWVQNNTWFGENDEMTTYAIDTHSELIADGIDPNSDEYYTAIDEKMRIEFPEYFSQDNVLDDQQEIGEVVVDEYTLTVDGSDLIFEGRIEIGLYDDMKNILLDNPAINRLVMNSTGGLEETAFYVTDLIIDFELDTHTSGCESSCTLLFVAGNKRTLQRGHKIGFHRSYWSADSLEYYYDYHMDKYDNVFDFTSWVYEDTQDWVFKKMQYFIERGIEPLFIIKTLRAGTEGMWYPRRKELLNANFITE